MKVVDWVVLLLPITLTGILGLFFNAKLEKQKHILQKKIQDFSLYNEKKHLCYSELYKLMKEAQGHIFGLKGLISRPSFDDYNKDDIESYLNEIGTTQKVVNDVVDLWEVNKDKAIKKVREYEKLRDLTLAKNALIKAKNFWLLNELYFIEDTSDKLDEYFQKLNELYINYSHIEEVSRIENREIKKEVEDKFNVLKARMKDELSSFIE